MTTYYVIVGSDAGVIGCEFSKAKAIKAARAEGTEGTYVDAITISCSPREAVRRLLGNGGGYAATQETVYTIGALGIGS